MMTDKQIRFGRLAPLSALALSLAMTGCSTVDRLAQAPSVPGPGTPPSPAVQWAAPANTRPPEPSKPQLTLPPNFTPGMPVSLAEVIDLALANNTTTRTTWLQARAAEAQLGSSRAAYLPEIDATAVLARQKSSSGSLQTTYGPSLALNYLLFDFGGRAAEVEQARQTLIAVNYTHNQAIQDVILRTQEAYYGYLDAKALLAAQDSTLRERAAALEAAEARHRAGVATIADVLQARTARSQAQLTREAIEGNLRTIEGLLATTMGLPASTRFDFGELPLDVPAQRITEEIEALLARAAAERPELAAARALAERARARITEVRAQGMPSVSLSSSIARTWYGAGSNTSFTTPYAASVAVRFPLFTGFRNTFDIRRAEIEAQIAAEDVREAEQRVNLQVWTSYHSLQTAAQRLTTARDLLSSAQQSVEVASSRYRAGVGSIIDLLTAEAALENARAQEVQARADWFTAVAQLAHDTGTLGVAGSQRQP